MAALSLTSLGLGVPATGGLQGGKAGLNSVEAFQEAMSRQASDPSGTAVQAPQPAADATPAVGDVQSGPPADAAARERVRHSLGLEGAPSPASAGDTILGGLTKLRSVFDARQAHLNDLMSSSATNTQVLYDMQMEVAQYTIMVDVSSKLTGKASSTLDTLMKGQ